MIAKNPKIKETLERFRKTAQEALKEDVSELAEMKEAGPMGESKDADYDPDVDPLFDSTDTKFTSWAEEK